MANRYGRGHPWLECRELRAIAHQLSQTDSRIELLGAARELLDDRPSGNGTMVARY